MKTKTECKEVFKKYNEKYSDEEIQAMLDLLLIYVEIDLETLKKQKYGEDRNIHEQSQQR